MFQEPQVSIVVPFFNAASFLEEAVHSVFAQTHKNWELLLVDDGCTDDSPKIALGFAERYPNRVRYLRHDKHRNRGSSASRNLGVRHADAEYIAFLDSDDVWLPQKLERQIEILSSQPAAAMVYGRTEYWYSWTGNSADFARDVVFEPGVDAGHLMMPPLLLQLFLQGKARSPSVSNTMVRRRIFEDLGGFEEHFRGMYDDQAFFAKVCVKYPVYVAIELWDRYRQHSSSCCATSDRTGRHEFERQQYLQWLERYLAAQASRDPQLWKALKDKQRKFCRPALQNWLTRARYSTMRTVLADRLRPWLGR